MDNNPSWGNGVHTDWPYQGTNTDYGVDLNRPVEMVSWSDATNYCAALTERERTAEWIATNAVYRLPTEAEWEYACRGWTSTRFSYGDDPGYTNLTNYAWYDANSGGVTHPVGQKLPNATVSISDNDVGVQFVYASYSVAEDAGAALIRVLRGRAAPAPRRLAACPSVPPPAPRSNASSRTARRLSPKARRHRWVYS
jgi:hypothetical protein